MGNLVARLQRENQTAAFNVVITPEMEQIFATTLQSVGACSTILSVSLIYLIIFRSPAQGSKRLQLDLIGLQICFLVFDLHYCCLFIPKSTFPYSAGYCLGVLCGPISFHPQFLFSMVVLVETLAMFFVCLLQRFVTITKYLSNVVALNVITSLSIIVPAIGPVYIFCLGSDTFSKEYMMQYLEITPKMMWLVEKRTWVIYFIQYTNVPVDVLARLASIAMFILVVLYSVGSITLIAIISKYLSKSSLSSTKSQEMRAAAIRNLILQFTVFSVFLSIPIMVILIPLLLAIESGAVVFLIFEAILSSHGLACSIVAIAFNPNMRRAMRAVVGQKFSVNSQAAKMRTTIIISKWENRSQNKKQLTSPLSLLKLRNNLSMLSRCGNLVERSDSGYYIVCIILLTIFFWPLAIVMCCIFEEHECTVCHRKQ